MSPEEMEIVEFLKRFRGNYVSLNEISRNVGPRKRFLQDRYWTRPILRRMEMEGCVESNEFAEYRLIRREEDSTSFWKAIEQPSMELGETTIIELDETTDTKTQF